MKRSGRNSGIFIPNNPSTLEYRTKTWLKVFLWLIAIAFSVATIFAFNAPSSSAGKIGVSFFMLLAALTMCVGAINASMFVFSVDANELRVSSLFTSRSVRIEDIRGYRLIQGKNTQLNFIPLEKSVKPICISIDNLTKSKELVAYAKEHFSNIDEIEYKEELDALLNDERLGLTVEDRKAFLALRKNIAKGLNIAGIVAIFAVFFVPSSSLFLNILPVLFPLFALILVCISKGVVQLIGRAKAVHQTVIIAFVLPPIFFLIRVISAYKIYDLTPFWSQWLKWSAIIFIFFMLLLFSAAKEVRDKGSVMLLLGIALICAAGSLLFSNYYFDKSTPNIFEVKVLNKWKQSGKSTTYYLSVSPWGKYEQEDKETVSGKFYNSISIGDPVKVSVKQGRYNIAWYWLSHEEIVKVGRINAP